MDLLIMFSFMPFILWLGYGVFSIGNGWHGKLKDKSFKGVINYWLLASINLRELGSNEPIRVVPPLGGEEPRYIYCDGGSIYVKSGKNGYWIYNDTSGFNVGVNISAAWYLRGVVLAHKRQVKLNKRQEEESRGKEMSKVVEEIKNADKSR